MRSIIAIAIVMMLSGTAEVRTWSGPGDHNRCNQCAEACDPVDALMHVPDEARQAIAAQMNSPPVSVPLLDGDLLNGIAYCGGWDEGWRRVEGDHEARGWAYRMEDGTLWAVTVVTECGNPAVLVRRPARPVTFSISQHIQPSLVGYVLGGRSFGGGGFGGDGGSVTVDNRTPDGPNEPEEPPVEPEVPPIPLPPTLLMLLAALGGLAMLRGRAR